MRRILNVMPLILLAASLPAFSVQTESPGPGSTHRIQVFRAGKGEPRVRDAEAARTASPRPPNQVQDTGRTRPYQAAKPGEGEPKG
ncbi:MAG: hypothetical protein Q8K67_14060 [Geothrix sp.]|nr:hypothetical protein [Geothrix sp.]